MKKVKVGKSKIHGNGLFADEPIKRGDVIELVHTIRELEPGVIKTTPTLLGRNYNHSEDSNALNVVDGNNRYLVALKEIEVGGEITTDYRTNPDLEQPDSFTSNDNYISFDYDDTLTTPEGFKLAQQMNKDGKNLYVITARDKVTPQMIERAEAAGIPKENIIPAGSDEAKVRIIKENNINKHIDNKDSVIKALGDKGELFVPDAYPDLKADFVEMDLSDDDLNKLREGGFIIDKYPNGGLVEVRGYEGNKFRKNANGKWEYESGRPVEDQLLIQKLTYESKPVGSPVVQGAPKVSLKPIPTRSENLKRVSDLSMSPRIADQEKAAQLSELQREQDIFNPQEPDIIMKPKNMNDLKGYEFQVNRALGFPMDKAHFAAEAAAGDVNEEVDNFRHPLAGRYVAEGIANATGNIPYISPALGFIGSNLLGAGHEFMTLVNPGEDDRSLLTRLSEAGEDVYNNYIGAKVGASDMTPEEKTNYLLYLSYNNKLPDGVVIEKDPKAKGPNNLYFKKGPNDPGRYKSSYAEGGELDVYAKGGDPGKGKKGKSKKVEPFVTSDPKEYAYRKAAYDDSLSLFNSVAKNRKELLKTFDFINYGPTLTEAQVKKIIDKKNPNQLRPVWESAGLMQYGKFIIKKDKNHTDKHPSVSGRYEKQNIYNDYKKDKSKIKPIGWQPELFHNKKYDPKKLYNYAGVYKKPVQEVIFQKEIKEDPIVKPIIPIEQPQPPIQNNYPPTPTPKFVEERIPEPPRQGTDVMPVYDTNELPMYATPDPDAEWVGKTERYIDWDGNSVGYNLPRVRKPGHGGDLIRKGKRRYLHFPSIESRYQAEIVPEEEYKKGGEPKKKKRKTDDYGRYRSEDGNVRTPITPEMQAVMPPDEWGQYIQEFPEVYTTRTKEEQDIRNALDYQQKMAELYPGRPTQSDAIQPADWFWQLGMLGAASGLGKSAVQAAEAVGSRALPYITGALETSIPGMASVPGATVGNALGAMAAVDSGRRLLDVPSQVQKGEYADAAANVLTGALDIGTAGMISPLYKGAKATATELKAALEAKNPANFEIPKQWYKKSLYDLYDKGTDSYKLVEIDVPQEVIPARSYDDVKHKLKNLRSDLNISPTEHYLSRIFGRSPIGMSRDRTIADPRDGKLFDSNTRYWLNRLYGNTPSGEEVISKHLLAKDYGKLYKEGLSFEEAQGIMKQYNDPIGYKEVPKELPGSPNGTFAYKNVTPSKVRSTNTGLTNEDIDKEVANNIKWITSKEYARRRAANTGESLQEIQKSVDKIIKDADKAKFNLNANPKYMDLYDAEGVMSKKKWFRPAKVEVAADSKHPVKTLNHEIKHLYSPAIFDNRKVYKNYPALTAEDHYLTLGPEQQVRHLNAREQILAENNLPIDAQLSEEQVREFVDGWGSKVNKMNKTKDFSSAEDFDDLWSEQAGSIQKEMLKARYNTDDLNFIGTLPTSQKVKFMSEYRDRLTRSITDVLNKAWMTVPIAGGAGLNSLETSEQRYGGSISKLNKFIR